MWLARLSGEAGDFMRATRGFFRGDSLSRQQYDLFDRMANQANTLPDVTFRAPTVGSRFRSSRAFGQGSVHGGAGGGLSGVTVLTESPSIRRSLCSAWSWAGRGFWREW